jgi:hypothetical protein
VTAAFRSRLFWQKGRRTGRQALCRIGFRGAGGDCDAGPGMHVIAGFPPAANISQSLFYHWERPRFGSAANCVSTA